MVTKTDNNISLIFIVLFVFIHEVTAFTGPSLIHSHRKSLALGETKSIIDGIEFDTIVREWSCKWSPGGSKASLLACQMALEAVFDDLNDIEGVQNVERLICDETFEFKVITSISMDKFDAWEDDDFEPEECFIEMLEVIDGVSDISTQTWKKISVVSTEFNDDDE